MNLFLEIIPYEERINPNRSQHPVKQFQTQTKKKRDLRPKVIKPKESKPKKQVKFKWETNQSKKYINFLIDFQTLFGLSLKEKRDLKINKRMSKAIKTRDPRQCHSHHQKMMKKHQSIQSIIEAHEQKFGNQINMETKGEQEVKTQVFKVDKCKEESLETQELQSLGLSLENLKDCSQELLVELVSYPEQSNKSLYDCLN